MSDAQDTGSGAMHGNTTDPLTVSAIQPSTPSARSSHREGQPTHGGDTITGEANTGLHLNIYAPVVGDSSSSISEFSDDPLVCPHCEKVYLTERNLRACQLQLHIRMRRNIKQNHIRDKKGTCRKPRKAADVMNNWACPRCHARMSSKYSVARHLKVFCWKVCDECCEIRRIDCNSQSMDDGCSTCLMAGKSCTKHAEPMANCVPVLLTDAQAKAKDEIHWTNEVASDSGQIQDKRKAVKSPDNSPKSKPNVKRNKESKKKDNMTVLNSYESSKQEERSALVNMQAFMQTITPDQSPQLPMNLPQPPHLRPGYTTARVRPGAGQQSSRMLPPTTSRVSGGNPQATELGMSNAQLLRLQHDAFQRMASMPEYRSNHFVNQHRASMASGSRPGFNLEQHGLGNQQQYGGGLLPAFESGFQAYQNRPVYGFNDGRINQPMAQGILQSLAQARQKSMAGPQLPAPGSLTSSRQSSRQASTEHLPSSLDSNAPGQRGTQNHKVETGGLLVKHERPSTPLLNDPFEEANNPTLRIRIYSGLLDPTSTPIFSILTMRRHDPFGPRLEYYCTQRGALFGRDWKFVFKYHAPTPHDPNATRYLDIPFDLTPSQCIDTDYPAAAMRDGDTIVCVRNTKPSPTSELHAAMDCQRIDIANGETRVWQDRDVNAAWYNDLEASQASTKRQVGAMHGTIMSLRREKMEDGGVIEGLREENAKLKVELAAMRLASLRDAKEDFATEDEEDTKF